MHHMTAMMDGKTILLALVLASTAGVGLALVLGSQSGVEQHMVQADEREKTGISGPRVYAPVEPSKQGKEATPKEVTPPPKEGWKPGDPVRERRDLKRSDDVTPK